jgi:selenocysteine-specific elongation factor
VVDVPGHERFVRTMVAGATGIDLFLLCVAADDGVMPQTREHLRVLRALGVERGVVAVTKCDAAEPPALADLPDVPRVPVSARTGAGLAELRGALDAVAGDIARQRGGGGVVLHVDRVFTIRGAGTVVTGTLWSGRVEVGQTVTILPSGKTTRVRGVQVHDSSVPAAEASQRVALNLVGVGRDDVARGDVITTGGAGGPTSRYRIDAELDHEPPPRVMVHHGTRETAARVVRRGDGWSLRCEKPLIVSPGDRLVVRSIAPPDTLGGGVVRAAPKPPPSVPAAETPTRSRLEPVGVRIGREYWPPERVAELQERVEAILPATLAEARDALGLGRKATQAFLEYLDRERVTLRRGDVRVSRRRAARTRPGSS